MKPTLTLFTRPATILFAIASFSFSVLWVQKINSVKENPPRVIEHDLFSEPMEDIKSDKDWFMVQRMYPKNNLPSRVTDKMERSLKTFVEKNAAPPSAQNSSSWTLVGPTNIGGRVTSIIIHPSNPDIMYIGAASGGVWKTTDFGYTWTNVFNESFSIGSLAIDPTNSNIIYVGTGEANPSSVDTYPGNGVWRSTNAGTTWTNLGLAETGHIGKIVINPLNPNTMYLAALGLYRSKNTDKGIYKTTNGGISWNKILFVDDTTGCTDIAIDPSDTSRLIAASFTYYRTLQAVSRSGPGSGLHVSTNAGLSWSQVTSGFPYNNSDIGRISIDFAPSDPSIVYALVASGGGYNWDGVYKSFNHGEDWFKVFDNMGTFGESQVWYNCILRVHPLNPDWLWTGMTNMYNSTNGGSTFDYSSLSGSSHPDYHAIEYAPSDPSKVVFGDDGGLFTSTDGGTTWVKCLNLPITQFYAGSFVPQNPHGLLGGTQDNSSMRTTNSIFDSWSIFYGGDGFYCLVDPTDSNYVYAEYQYGGLGYSTNGGASFNNGTSGINFSEPINWCVPIAMDFQHPKTLYTGTNYLYKTTDNMQSWTKISPILTTGQTGFFSTLTTIDVSKTNSYVIYVGTGDGKVWMTASGGTTWYDVSDGLPNRWVSRVTVDPNNDNIAYVTLSGFREYDNQGHLFRTTNYGANWTDIGTALPDIPLNDVVVDPLYPNTLYIASDLNVMMTANLGANWSVLGNNLPEVTVHDLDFHPGSRKLAAFTHGRSVYTYDLPSTELTILTVSLQKRWNLVSNPVDPPDSSTSTLFPDAVSDAFEFAENNSYYIQNTLEPGKGFWLKFPDTVGLSTSISGTVLTSLSIPVHAGWNLVGSISQAIEATTIGSVPPGIVTSDFYSFDNGYFTSAMIQPGKGYWVKVSQSGTLTLSSSSIVPPSKRIKIISIAELPPPPPNEEVNSSNSQIPDQFALEQNYPNPFNPSTVIRYSLPALKGNRQYNVQLKIYDLLGKEIATLVNQTQEPGIQSVEWNASGLPSGIYLYKIVTSEGFTAAKKMVLMR